MIARTSSFSFRGKEVDVREIGSRLKVENILERSVRKAWNRIRVTAQLVNASDGYRLWSERYDLEMNDVFAIQDEICQAIVGKLRVELATGGHACPPRSRLRSFALPPALSGSPAQDELAALTICSGPSPCSILQLTSYCHDGNMPS